MKEVNLVSIVHAFNGLSKPLYESYYDLYKVITKEDELQDLSLFIEELQKISPDVSIVDDYFLGYTIPQISKEFDLLRFGNNDIVNIELKSENTGVKIYKQIIRNQYYLSFLKKKVHSFTYVSSENKLYTLDKSGTLVTANFTDLVKILANQKIINIPDIDNLFNPSNYLVSPFNSTSEFIKGNYFLTAHQEEIKKDCIKLINTKSTSFVSICGKAGTGKTLLTFDIAKEFINISKKVLVIHCGYLNQGHRKLQEKYGWEIVAIKNWTTYKLSNYSLIIIDETQRIYPLQLISMIDQIKANNGNCIFSYDKQQCLRQWEIDNNISQVISDRTSSKTFQLTEKIRTNKEIASFIISLFDKSKTIEKIDRSNIELYYFQNSKEAKQYIRQLGEEDWKIINYTQSNRHKYPYDEYNIFTEDNAHAVIGQEYDKVIAVIDECFFYNGNKLATRYYRNSPYYHPTKMLFQIMTRTRRKLCVIVINNEDLLSRCLSILN